MTRSLNTKSDAGCLILAGGMGTRLGFEGPKGCIELPLKEKKTLFQILLEKVKDSQAPIAIMTSPLNHEKTLDYLENQHFFGLKNVTLFQQGMDQGFPNGNGKAFTYFCQQGIWERWKQEGIHYLQVLPIDNPLATPFDEELIRECHGVDLTLRGVKRRGLDEKIGVIIEGKRLQVEEYTEKTHLDETLLGNTGIFVCTLDFVKRGETISLPPHTVCKKIKGVWTTRREYFIFDLFPYAKTFKVLVSERRSYFAPIKNASGPDSPDSVAQELMRL